MRLNEILKKPILTEKSVTLTESDRYTFKVNKKAKKGAVAQAVEKEFGVNVESVKMIVVPGKTKRVRGTSNIFTKTASWKKAVVKLKSGQKIDMFTKLLGENK